VQYRSERQQIVDFGRSLFDRGYAFGSSGNLSMRVHSGYIVTPTNQSLGELNPASLSLLDEDWNLVDGEEPTKEIPMHRAFYRASTENSAVVHLHSTNATAVSCLLSEDSWTLPFLTPYMVMRLGLDIGVIPYLPPGDQRLEQEVDRVAGHSRAVLLRNHGLATTGKSLKAATIAAEEFEEAAKLYLLLGNRPYVPLSPEDLNELVQRS